MRFAAPQFLILLPFLAIAGWYFRRLELWRPLRAAALVLVVLILVDPQIRRTKDGMDLWVLVDRSASAEEIVAQNFEEWRNLLEKAKPTGNDRLMFVDYAAEVVTKPNAETATYPGNRNLTRTGLALQDVIALADSDKHTRILAFTDGFSTEPLTGVAEKLQEMGIPLDYRLLAGEDSTDFRITEFNLPSRSQLGEPFIIDITVAGNADAEVPVMVARENKQIAEATVSVVGGRGSLRFTDRIIEPGSFNYEVVISPQEDAHNGNNRYLAWIEITAGPRVLLATKYLNDPVAQVLQAQGFDVQVVEDPFSLHVGMLSGTKNVILNNVPAYEVPQDFLEALNFFVSEQGGGLMMAGGKQSFGSGGYYESSIDPLLPVSMKLKSEHRKLAVAMAIVMDRSGSMSMTVASGHSKMDLANEGAGRAVEHLTDQDLIAVNAVDSQSHEIVPLTPVGPNRAEIESRVRSIESMGGGIFVFTGLKAAWEQLKQAEVGQRHIILFTDANDSEEPGTYKSLVEEIVKNSGSISVIGLGTRADSDAAFIEDIAKRGNGRIFFTDVAGDLPNIFAQETVTVARSTFIEDAIGTQPTGSWYEISSKDFEWLSEVDGYNLSYTREDDTAALLSLDEYKAPLVAYGRRGIGRTAAVSFALGGEFSERSRNWDKMGDFMQTLNRWLMGEQVPAGIGVRHELNGTELTIDLLYDETEWRDQFAANPPRVVLSRESEAGRLSELTWERLAPGHFSVRSDLQEGELVRGAIQVGKTALPFGPVVVGTSTEWAFDSERVSELRSASAVSDGRELLELEQAWQKPQRKQFAGIQSWLLILLLSLLLAEALVTRTGWKMPELALLRQRSARRKAAKAKKAKPAARKKRKAVGVVAPSETELVEEDESETDEPAEVEKAAPTSTAAGAEPAEPEVPEKSAEEAARERRTRFARAKRRK